ncbi:hypothetical protein [Pedobacter foliorum]|uniref:hypothetical protein n=1 Tax=Pedobacter foliorum TaxID=2739058 RepID=UPI001564C028|nr:hypothetical protein [Pedobacter foliorum]NRF37612.1 hypothetical protein [Pedobacter foliorum]
MQLNYESEKYQPFTEINGITFKRKLENETAFDGIVKIYSIETSSSKLNQLLMGKFFGSFFFSSGKGIFLRMFDGKDSWPNTNLIFINLEDIVLEKIKKTRSSWDVWMANDLGDGKYSIDISPDQSIEYQTR